MVMVRKIRTGNRADGVAEEDANAQKLKLRDGSAGVLFISTTHTKLCPASYLIAKSLLGIHLASRRNGASPNCGVDPNRGVRPKQGVRLKWARSGG